VVEGASEVKIAIDGPAGAGKSTVARIVSGLTGYQYVDTGAMYRALALLALEKGIDFRKEGDVTGLAERFELRFCWDRGDFRAFLGQRDVTGKLRSREVDGAVKVIAALPRVRDFMVGRQREIAASGDVVMEGRDITSVVLPDAEVKVYLTGDFRERVRRRWLEMVENGAQVPWEVLKAEMASRDEADLSRKKGPLVQVADAVVIDTTGKTASEVARIIVNLCDERKMAFRGGATAAAGSLAHMSR